MPRGSNQRGRQRGQYAEITNADRQRLIRAYEGGEQDYYEVADTLQINRSTAYSIMRRHRNGLPLQRIRGGRRPQVVVLTDEVVQKIVRIVEEHADFTLKQIQQKLQEDAIMKCANMVRHVLTYMGPCLARENILF